ncbi:MAG: hypothetical protein MJ088_05665, partial [Clostridia bacterium]|nr:hypothetical protein [Clostridia bacterium]
AGAARRDDVTDEMLADVAKRWGEPTARLLARYLHLYDFRAEKRRELAPLSGAANHGVLCDLMRLPGVFSQSAFVQQVAGVDCVCERADSGLTVDKLAALSTEEIRDAVRRYIEENGRTETVPLVKEVNCHRAVARMIVHLKKPE